MSYKKDTDIPLFLFDNSEEVDKATNNGYLAQLATRATEFDLKGRVVYVPECLLSVAGSLDRQGAKVLIGTQDNYEVYAHTKQLWQLNQEVVFIRNPGFIVNRGTRQIMRPKEFTDIIYANRRHIDYSLKEKSAAAEWLKWERRAELEEITYAPGKGEIVDNKFNMWSGWGDYAKQGDVTPWHNLMDHIFGNDSEHKTWFERWCAHQLQNPGVKLYSAVFMYGELEGTGKSLIGKTLGQIFGSNYSKITSKELAQPHNEWADCKQFVMIDDMSPSYALKCTDTLKSLITQETITITPRYSAIHDLPDCIAYYMTANDKKALKFSIAGGNRRFFIYEVDKRKPVSFYSDYAKWLNNGGAYHLFYYLLNLDLGDFNPRADAPATELGSRDHLKRWIRRLADNPYKVLGASPRIMTTHELIEAYGFKISPHMMTKELNAAGIERTNAGYIVKRS